MHPDFFLQLNEVKIIAAHAQAKIIFFMIKDFSLRMIVTCHSEDHPKSMAGIGD